jgi:putative protease
MVEIMAPAGSYDALQAAIKAGADSIYFGVEQLNMRSRSANFQLDDLPKIAKICQDNNVKSYLTVNTVIYNHDLNLLHRILDSAKEAGVTACIIMDIAAMQYAREIGLEVHSSTQLNISNIEAVKFYANFADVMVLAREVTLPQIKRICEQIKEQDVRGPAGNIVGIEIFVHGALCVAISGKCHMSLATDNASANRGACVQNCRKKYRVIDDETGVELKIDNNYVMSPQDLCTIGFLDQIIDSGVEVLKIEGRAKGADYVHTVVKCYKDAVNAIADGTYSQEKVKGWMAELKTVYNRGFWEGGYYLGKKIGEWSAHEGSKATKLKTFVGRVLNYYPKPRVAHIHLEAAGMSAGDQVYIMGPTTGIVMCTADEIIIEEKNVKIADKGSQITLKVSEKVRKNDKVYVVRQR